MISVQLYTFKWFRLNKPGSIFSSLETIFQTLVHNLPSVGLTKIISFLVLPPFIFLSLDFVSGKWQNLVHLGPPGALALLHTNYNEVDGLEGPSTIFLQLVTGFNKTFKIL